MSDTDTKDQKHRIACSGCRRIKVRCLPVTEESDPFDVCARCSRLKLDSCEYVTNKRGRKTNQPSPAIIVKANPGSHSADQLASSSAKPPPRKKARLPAEPSRSSPSGSDQSSEGPTDSVDPLHQQPAYASHLQHPPPSIVQPLPPSHMLDPPSYPPTFQSQLQNGTQPSPSSFAQPALPSPSAWSPPFPTSSFQPQPQPQSFPFQTTTFLPFPHPTFNARPVTPLRQPPLSSGSTPTYGHRPLESFERGTSPAVTFTSPRFGPDALGSSSSVTSSSTGTGARPKSRAGEASRTRTLSVVDMLDPVTRDRDTSPTLEEQEPEELVGGLDDPVRRGIVAESDVDPLFHSFHTRMNPLSCQLDPILHTPTYVRTLSPILFAAVLTAASKVERPDLYPPLLAFANELVVNGFASGTCEVEFVQAISILSFSKPAADSASFRRVGYAIRLALELDLHLPFRRPLPEDDLEARKLVARERIWIQIICFDRTLTLQQGRPRMIEPEYEPDVDAWSSDHARVWISEDATLAASYESLKMSGVIMTARKSSDLDVKRMLLDHQTALFARWQKDWTGENTKLPFSTIGMHSVRYFGTCFAFELAMLNLSLAAKRAELATSSKFIGPDPVAGPSTFTETPESLIAFNGSVKAARAVLAYFVEHMSGILPFAQDAFVIAVAAASIFLARNISRVSHRSDIVDLMKGAAHMCRSAAKQPVDSAAYQTRFFLSLLRAMSTSSGLAPSRAPSRPASPRQHTSHTPLQTTKKKPPLGPVDLSLLDSQLSGIEDGAVGVWNVNGEPSTTFDEVFGDVSNWFPGFDSFVGDGTNWSFGDLGAGAGDWGGPVNVTIPLAPTPHPHAPPPSQAGGGTGVPF